MSKEVKENAELTMDAAVEAVKRRASKLRTGKASPALLDGLMVEYYGAPTPLKQLATIAVPEPRLLALKPFDRAAISAIERAIQASNLGLNPSNDGMMIRLQIPELTEERRREFTKMAREIGEEGKVAVRHARQEANDELKRELKDSEITEDEHRADRDEIQKLTDRYCADIDQIVEGEGSGDHGDLRDRMATDPYPNLDDDGLADQLVARGSLPRHVAIIMDGNGRWARRRCLPRAAGHRAGRHAVRAVVRCLQPPGHRGPDPLHLQSRELRPAAGRGARALELPRGSPARGTRGTAAAGRASGGERRGRSAAGAAAPGPARGHGLPRRRHGSDPEPGARLRRPPGDRAGRASRGQARRRRRARRPRRWTRRTCGRALPPARCRTRT